MRRRKERARHPPPRDRINPAIACTSAAAPGRSLPHTAGGALWKNDGARWSSLLDKHSRLDYTRARFIGGTLVTLSETQP
jgi:hypothetical protein